jgi:hypothetical protein
MQRGADVQALQQQLQAQGYNVGPRGADRIYGPRTAAAVKQLQSAAGIAADGRVGPQTRAALAQTQAQPLTNINDTIAQIAQARSLNMLPEDSPMPRMAPTAPPMAPSVAGTAGVPISILPSPVAGPPGAGSPIADAIAPPTAAPTSPYGPVRPNPQAPGGRDPLFGGSPAPRTLLPPAVPAPSAGAVATTQAPPSAPTAVAPPGQVNAGAPTPLYSGSGMAIASTEVQDPKSGLWGLPSYTADGQLAHFSPRWQQPSQVPMGPLPSWQRPTQSDTPPPDTSPGAVPDWYNPMSGYTRAEQAQKRANFNKAPLTDLGVTYMPGGAPPRVTPGKEFVNPDGSTAPAPPPLPSAPGSAPAAMLRLTPADAPTGDVRSQVQQQEFGGNDYASTQYQTPDSRNVVNTSGYSPSAFGMDFATGQMPTASQWPNLTNAAPPAAAPPTAPSAPLPPVATAMAPNIPPPSAMGGAVPGGSPPPPQSTSYIAPRIAPGGQVATSRSAIRANQQMLSAITSPTTGRAYYTGRVDGINGPQTQAAVADFQRDNGLRVDTRIGQQTGPAIASTFAAGIPAPVPDQSVTSAPLGTAYPEGAPGARPTAPFGNYPGARPTAPYQPYAPPLSIPPAVEATGTTAAYPGAAANQIARPLLINVAGAMAAARPDASVVQAALGRGNFAPARMAPPGSVPSVFSGDDNTTDFASSPSRGFAELGSGYSPVFGSYGAGIGDISLGRGIAPSPGDLMGTAGSPALRAPSSPATIFAPAVRMTTPSVSRFSSADPAPSPSTSSDFVSRMLSSATGGGTPTYTPAMSQDASGGGGAYATMVSPSVNIHPESYNAGFDHGFNAYSGGSFGDRGSGYGGYGYSGGVGDSSGSDQSSNDNRNSGGFSYGGGGYT